MNKTVLKIFSCFVVSAVTVTMVLLVVNFFAFALTASDGENLYGKSPRKDLDLVSDSLTQGENGYACSLDADYFTQKKIWCILIGETGDVLWEQNKPAEIASHFSINDVAKMTRWYLNDYPVYVKTRDDGLLVLGWPKDTVGKYFVDYSMEWFDTLPERVSAVLLLNVAAATLLAVLIGIVLYRRLKALMGGIDGLKREAPVRLQTKGIFKEITGSINETSRAIERKNAALKKRDDARANWIAGISHDIRTPLSVIMGYAEELTSDEALSAEEADKAQVIMAQSIKIKKLIEDLNLISSLEYDMQPAHRKEVRLCGLLRCVVSEVINSGLSEKYSIRMDLQWERAAINGDEQLLKRAFFNIIYNSITHNPQGCDITVTQYRCRETAQSVVCISDNGVGVDEKLLRHLDMIPKSAHGLGLPMAYRIVHVHGGRLVAQGGCGMCITIYLPASS